MINLRSFAAPARVAFVILMTAIVALAGMKVASAANAAEAAATDNTGITLSDAKFDRWSKDTKDANGGLLYANAYEYTDGWAFSDRGTFSANFSSGNATVKSGDTFWIDLPTAFRALSTAAFDMKDDQGNKVGTCQATNDDNAGVDPVYKTATRVKCTIALDGNAVKTDFKGSLSINVEARDTMETTTPALATSAGSSVTATLTPRTWTKISDPATDHTTWTDKLTSYNSVGIIPRDSLKLNRDSVFEKAGTYGKNSNNWRIYFGKDKVAQDGTITITDVLGPNQTWDANSELKLESRSGYLYTDPRTGIEHYYVGNFQASEQVKYPNATADNMAYTGTLSPGISQNNVKVTTTIIASTDTTVSGDTVVFTISGIDTTKNVLDYRLVVNSTQNPEGKDEYTNQVTTGDKTVQGNVIKPGTAPSSQANAQYTDGTGGFSVTKQVSGEAPADTEYSFEIKIGDKSTTVNLKGGATYTSGSLKVGTQVSIKEIQPTVDGYTFEAPTLTATDATVAGEGFAKTASFTIANQKKTAVTVVNTAKKANTPAPSTTTVTTTVPTTVTTVVPTTVTRTETVPTTVFVPTPVPTTVTTTVPTTVTTVVPTTIISTQNVPTTVTTVVPTTTTAVVPTVVPTEVTKTVTATETATSIATVTTTASASNEPSSLGSSNNEKCVAAVTSTALPLLLLIPFGVASQVHLPGVDKLIGSLNTKVSAQTAQAVIQAQKSLGIYNAQLAKQFAGISQQLNAVTSAIPREAVVGIAGTILGLAALGYVGSQCLTPAATETTSAK